MRILIFLLILPFSLFGQGLEPSQIQYSPYKSGYLKATIPIYDEFEQDTVYYYSHVDSLLSGGGGEYDLIPYTVGLDTLGFILYDSQDTVVIEAGNPIIIGGKTITDGFGIDSFLQGDSTHVVSVDTNLIATQYDIANLASNINYVDGTTIDFTLTGNNLTAEVKANSIGATQLASTAVTAGTYKHATITVDADGRITSASDGYDVKILGTDYTTNTTSWNTVSGLQLTIPSAGIYEVKGLIAFTLNSLVGLSYGFSSTTTMDFATGYINLSMANNTTYVDRVATRDVNIITTSPIWVGASNSTSGQHFGSFNITFKSSGANTLYFNIASITNGQNVTVEANSFIKMTKLN